MSVPPYGMGHPASVVDAAEAMQVASAASRALSAAAEARRRKVRKGTHSCWECRRRKIRCQYTSPDDAVCIGCLNRGSACRSQELPDEPVMQQHLPERKVAQRLEHLEDMMQRLMTHVIDARPSQQRGRSPSPSDARDSVEAYDADHLVHHVSAGKDVLETSTADDTPVAALLGIQDALPAATAAAASGSRDDVQRQGSPQSMDEGSAYGGTDGSGGASDHGGTFTDSSPSSSGSATTAATNTSLASERVRLRRLSDMLYSLFPTQGDMDVIASGSPSHYVVSLFHSMHDIEQGRGEPPSNVAIIPPASSHPTVLARRLLQVALCLQQIAPVFTLQHKLHFDEPLPKVIDRIAAVVTQTVTSNDDLIGTVEGLQCMILMGEQQSGAGQLRRAWLSYRRAMNVAQLMGLDWGNTRALKSCDPTSDPNCWPSPAILWYRINACDRYTSLLLGLQTGWPGGFTFGGNPDSGTGSDGAGSFDEATDTPVERLDKAHTALTGRIIERNHGRASPAEKLAATISIDTALRAAGDRLDKAWWDVPIFDPFTEPAFIFGQMARSILQVHHHCMLIMLHLPYMLRSDAPEGTTDSLSQSKSTCMNSSRAILDRFIRFRSLVNTAFSCRHVDYATLIAAMTLIVGYLGPQPAATQDQQAREAFEEQLRADQTMVQKVRDGMIQISNANNDKLSQESAATINKLLPILDAVLRRSANASPAVATPQNSVDDSVAALPPAQQQQHQQEQLRLHEQQQHHQHPYQHPMTAVGYESYDANGLGEQGVSVPPVPEVRLDVPYFGTVNIHKQSQQYLPHSGITSPSSVPTAPASMYATPGSVSPPAATTTPMQPAVWRPSPPQLPLPGMQQLPPQQNMGAVNAATAAASGADLNAMLVDFNPIMPQFSDGGAGHNHGHEVGGGDNMMNHARGVAGNGVYVMGGTTQTFPDMTGSAGDWVMQGIDTTYWSLLNEGVAGDGRAGRR